MSKTITICTEFTVDETKDIDTQELVALVNGATDDIPMEEIPEGVFVGISYACKEAH